MPTAVGLGLAAFAALLIYGVLSKSPETTIDDNLAQAKTAAAPNFELPLLQRGTLGPELSRKLRAPLRDGRLSVRELRGTPVVLNFWASWCVPCRSEAPRLERAWRNVLGTGIMFLGLNQQDLLEDSRAFMREFDNTYLNVRDESDGVSRDWGVTGLPETFFISRQGRVVGHVIGVVSPQQLRDGMAAAEANRPVGALQGGARRSTR